MANSITVKSAEIDARKRIEEVNAMTVTSRGDFETASAWLKLVVDYEKKVKAVEKEETAPLKASLRAIKDKYEKPLELLQEAQEIARKKLNDYLVVERKAEQARLQKEMEARQKAAEKEIKKLERKAAGADKYDDVTAEALRKACAEKAEELRADAATPDEICQNSANATVRMVWAFEIIDQTQLPAEYLIPDMTKIREAVRAGVREIPGVKIEQKPQIAVK